MFAAREEGFADLERAVQFVFLAAIWKLYILHWSSQPQESFRYRTCTVDSQGERGVFVDITHVFEFACKILGVILLIPNSRSVHNAKSEAREVVGAECPKHGRKSYRCTNLYDTQRIDPFRQLVPLTAVNDHENTHKDTDIRSPSSQG